MGQICYIKFNKSPAFYGPCRDATLAVTMTITSAERLYAERFSDSVNPDREIKLNVRVLSI